PAARLALAESAMTAKQYDRAAEFFRVAAEAQDPAARAQARSGLGWALLKLDKPQEAASAFDELLKDTPDDPHAPDAALALAPPPPCPARGNHSSGPGRRCGPMRPSSRAPPSPTPPAPRHWAGRGCSSRRSAPPTRPRRSRRPRPTIPRRRPPTSSSPSAAGP